MVSLLELIDEELKNELPKLLPDISFSVNKRFFGSSVKKTETVVSWNLAVLNDGMISDFTPRVISLYSRNFYYPAAIMSLFPERVHYSVLGDDVMHRGLGRRIYRALKNVFPDVPVSNLYCGAQKYDVIKALLERFAREKQSIRA